MSSASFRSLRARLTRRLVYVLCLLMVFGGQPLMALQETVRIVPREEHPEWLAPWFEAATYRGDPKWGVTRSSTGTLQERRGAAWDQSLLLHQLPPRLVAAYLLLHLASAGAVTGETEGDDPAVQALEALEVVASAPAEERAVLRAGDELVLIRPGDPLPGIAGSEVESIEPERIVARLDAFRQVWISTRGDGRVRVLDLRAPERPSAAGSLWIVPRPAGSSEEPKGDGR